MALNSTWAQFQGSPGNSGYIAVNTAPAVQPAHVGSIRNPVGSSPVVDPQNGFVYLTANDGILYQFQPDLVRRLRDHRRRVPPSWAGSTPAVDPAGNIYAIFGDPATPYANSALVCYTPSLGMRWKYGPPAKVLEGTTGPEHPGFLLGSPKIWNQGGQTLIFVVVCYGDARRDSYLLVLDQSGVQQASASIAHALPVDFTGGGRFSPGTAHVRGTSPGGGSVSTGTPGIAPSGGPTVSGVPLPNDVYLPEPSPCIVQDSAGPDRPVVVVTDGLEWIAALRYAPGQGLENLWGAGEKYALNVGIGPITSSPAVFPNGWLAFGLKDSIVNLVDDPANGGWDDVTQQQKGQRVGMGSRVSATPASFLRQMYVVKRTTGLSMIDSNGILKNSVALGLFSGAESVASPLVSGSFVHVAAADGVYTFDLLLKEQVAKFDVDPNDGMGVSSLAVGPDGTLYACSATTLYAFPPPP